MSEIDDLLKDMTAGLFGDLGTRDVYRAAEGGTFPRAVWDSVADAGLTSAFDPESETPQLLPLETLAIILRAAGEFNLPVPLGETLIAQRIAHQAGLSVPEGPLTIATGDLKLSRNNGGFRVTGSLRRVPWGRDATAIVAEARYGEETAHIRLTNLQPSGLDLNLANEPRDSFVLEDHALLTDAVAVPRPLENGILGEARVLRCLQMVGAMGSVLRQTVRYSGERVQFGRPIGRFQAVQHQVAEMATHVAAAAAATEAALRAVQEGPATFETRAAKIRVSEAAGVAARVAHQVHGAMGTTQEHALHLSTRRLWSWRDEFGSETALGIELGREIIAMGGRTLWQLVSTPHVHRSAEGAQG